MNIAGIFHRACAPWSYAVNEDELVIRLQTDTQVERVYLHWGDPFAGGILGGNWAWKGQRIAVTQREEIGCYQMWTARIQPQHKRCRYYFELHQGLDVWYYGENGPQTVEQEGAGQVASFVQPWMNEADIPAPPHWVPHTVWYQIFPDRFHRASDSAPEDGLCAWHDGPVTNQERYGGNLRGIVEKLDQLQSLGITGLYLNPIMEADSIHKYDTTDYWAVDRHFGTEEDLKTLVTACHARGMRVMLDGVFNHCGPKFQPWLDVKKHGPNSPYWHWFMVHQWPLPEKDGSTKDNRYYSFAFHGGMPKLNTNHPDVRKYLCDVCVHWVKDYGVDGIRFDVGNEVSHRFLKEMRQAVCAVNSEVYLLGEIWHDASPWLEGDEYDSVMNYPLRSAITHFFSHEDSTACQLIWDLRRCFAMYREQTNTALFNLLDSHDTERMWNCTPNRDSFLQQLALLFALPGSPCIYYGTEIALPGAHDPDDRRCMLWQWTQEQQEMREEVRKLISVRNTHDVLHSPHMVLEEGVQPRCVIVRRGNVAVYLNASKECWRVAGGGEALYTRHWDGANLHPGGIYMEKV